MGFNPPSAEVQTSTECEFDAFILQATMAGRQLARLLNVKIPILPYPVGLQYSVYGKLWAQVGSLILNAWKFKVVIFSKLVLSL